MDHTNAGFGVHTEHLARSGKVPVIIRVDSELRRQLKIAVATRNTTVQDLVTQLILDDLAKHEVRHDT